METYIKQHKKALQFLYTATDEYIGARCSLINGLITPGYVLSQQAIEKIIKSFILVLLPNEDFLKEKKYRPLHDLTPLLATLQATTPIDLSPFNNLCFQLSKAYPFLRYPENPHIVDSGIYSLSTAIIDQVDEMFLFIHEHMPIPGKVRSRIGPLSIMLSSTTSSAREWFIRSNQAYIKRMNYFNQPYTWWELDDEERKNHPPTINLLSVNGTRVNSLF
jgi:hypothetical protein